MSSSIEVTKSLLYVNRACYIIRVSDIYEKIENINDKLTAEIRLCFMQKYLNILVLDTEEDDDVTFELTEEIHTLNCSGKIEVDPWWIKLCWLSFLKEHELITAKSLISIGRPKIKIIDEIEKEF